MRGSGGSKSRVGRVDCGVPYVAGIARRAHASSITGGVDGTVLGGVVLGGTVRARLLLAATGTSTGANPTLWAVLAGVSPACRASTAVGTGGAGANPTL